MASETPIVRLFVACSALEWSEPQNQYTLVDVFFRIRPSGGLSFSSYRKQMALFALLTNARGTHSILIEMSRFDQGEDVVLFQTAPRTIDFGQDPLVVYGLPVPKMEVLFEVAGQYTFAIRCDGQRIAQYHVEIG